jgi:hypothetical protein
MKGNLPRLNCYLKILIENFNYFVGAAGAGVNGLYFAIAASAYA